MVENDRSGRAVGHDPGRRIRLVRNPNWNARLDDRPAHLDAIEIREGNDDATVLSRRVLEGESMINGDQPPPPAILREALTERKDQIQLVPSGGERWIALNTTIPPFDDVDVRRAVLAGFDRGAMRLAYGGEASGEIATHFLPPGFQGFDEAGGLDGPALDFLAQPRGDLELAAEYFRRAGFASGRYEGGETLLMVGENVGVGANAALVASSSSPGSGSTYVCAGSLSGRCSASSAASPAREVAICPNVGWLKDFADAQTFLAPTFDGDRILEAGNNNWSQLDDPAVNARMDRASLLTEPAERARAWAEIDAEITALAPAIPYLWPEQANLRSENVTGEIDQDTAVWSLPHMRLR